MKSERMRRRILQSFGSRRLGCTTAWYDSYLIVISGSERYPRVGDILDNLIWFVLVSIVMLISWFYDEVTRLRFLEVKIKLPS